MLKKASDTRASFGKNRVMATLAGVGRWTLVVLALCLALIGFLHLTRGTAVRHVSGVAVDGVSISVSEPEFPLMATMTTGAWLAPGNHVEVMRNGDGTYGPQGFRLNGPEQVANARSLESVSTDRVSLTGARNRRSRRGPAPCAL